MRSKTLISYQKGYCGQYADIEAMKPREARAYCLGVGHVAAGTLPLELSSEVLAALSVRRRRDGDGSEVTAMVRQALVLQLVSCSSKIECVKALRAVAYALDIPNDLNSTVKLVNALPHTFTCRSVAERELAANALRQAGAVITVPSPQDTVTSVWLRGDTVKRRSAFGALTAGAIANFPLDEEFTVTQVDPFDNTFIVRSKWVNAEDFVLVRRAVTEPPR